MDLKANPFFLKDEDIEWVRETFDKLTLEDKVGQIFVFNVPIFARKKKLQNVLDNKAGGVFLFTSLARFQVKKSSYLQKNSEIPLLIAGDLESGGFTGALNATFYNSQMGIGATNDESFAYNGGLVSGREGAAMGFNWTYSPVCDINYNHGNPITNIRSYSDRPELVSKMACAYIKGVQDSGVAATAKHWPGDGLDDRNQHHCTTINTFDMDTWRNTFGKIYTDVFNAGVKTIMTAHISLPSYDNINGKSVPGVLSRKLNVDLLRKELGFNGLIVTDALDMAGFNSHGPREEILPRVLTSGSDMLLFSSEREKDSKIIKNAIETGVISQERLNDAVMRILALKASLNLHKTKGIPKKKDKKKYVGCKEHKELSNECIKASITLAKSTENMIPISPEKQNKVLLINTGDFHIITRKFKSLLSAKGFKVDKYKRGIKKIYKNYDLIIFLMNEAVWFTKTNLRLNDLLKDGGMMVSPHTKIPTIFISLANPYHLYEIPTMKTLINCYNPTIRAQKILVEMLVGELPIKGVSPVDVYCNLEDAKP